MTQFIATMHNSGLRSTCISILERKKIPGRIARLFVIGLFDRRNYDLNNSYRLDLLTPIQIEAMIENFTQSQLDAILHVADITALPPGYPLGLKCVESVVPPEQQAHLNAKRIKEEEKNEEEENDIEVSSEENEEDEGEIDDDDNSNEEKELDLSAAAIPIQLPISTYNTTVLEYLNPNY